ncbi:MAG: hypothetical protein IKA67_00230, partial [Clostridia bacterium]|nr:hypothetical protein [Clostridia bacterium]
MSKKATGSLVIKNEYKADLNTYIEHATPEMKAALGAELGIADNEWDALKLQRFNEAAAAYRESGKLEQRRDEIKAKEKASAVAEGNESLRYS